MDKIQSHAFGKSCPGSQIGTAYRVETYFRVIKRLSMLVLLLPQTSWVGRNQFWPIRVLRITHLPHLGVAEQSPKPVAGEELRGPLHSSVRGPSQPRHRESDHQGWDWPEVPGWTPEEAEAEFDWGRAGLRSGTSLELSGKSLTPRSSQKIFMTDSGLN